MLKTEQRLRKQTDIKAVYSHGVRGTHKLVRIVFLKTDLPTSRCTVVVSQQVAKQAVVRNRIKRRLRAILDTILPHIHTSYDIILTAQPAARHASHQQLDEAVNVLFTKHHLYDS